MPLSQYVGPQADLDELRKEAEASVGAFDPKGIVDTRRRDVAAIVRPQGQPAFRAALLAAYSGRCALTDCDVADALEAAHITPYLGTETNHPTNGLLLRADIHTLFDLGLIAVDVATMTVVLAPSLTGSAYAFLAGRTLRQPADANMRPSLAALQRHLTWTGL